MKKVCLPLLCSAVAVYAVQFAGWAQVSAGTLVPEPVQVRPNASPNIIGSGARALGMGGAFIAVADDATAASWNPGGLTQLERPEISAVYSLKSLGEKFSTTAFVEPDGRFSVDLSDLNYLSIAYPFRRTIAGRNLVFSLNYQHKYDFDTDQNYKLRLADIHRSQVEWEIPGGPNVLSFMASARFTYIQNGNVDFFQKGSLSSLSPAFGIELTNRLSVGLTVHFWDDSLIPDNGWETRTIERPTLYMIEDLDIYMDGAQIVDERIPLYGTHTFDRQEEFDDIKGTSFTAGFLYKPTPRLSIGGVYHSKLSLSMKRTMFESHSQLLAYNQNGRLFFIPAFDFDFDERNLKIEFPSAFGLGVAYRFPNDKLTLSLDVTRRNWNEFAVIDKNAVTENAERVSPITGLPRSETKHKPTYSVRFGGEYVFINKKKPKQDYLPSLRGGLFYDPEPASGRDQNFWSITDGDGKPDDYYGFTLGAGVLIKNRVNIDVAYENRWGKNVRSDLFAGQAPFERGFSEDVRQHSFYVSTVVYF